MSNKHTDIAEYTRFGTRISDKVGCHGGNPFAQEKANQAKKMIEKAGFPELPKDEKKSE